MANQTEKIYEHAFIYMLTINEECYIGSTFNFNKRMSEHKSRCYNENGERYNCKIYTYIKDNGGWENVNIRIIDVYYLVTKKFKIETEQYYMDYFQTGLNTERAFTGVEPGLNKHEYDKQYYEHNKETLKEYQKKYRQQNTEKIKEYSENNKLQKKEYDKEYRENNRERIKQKKKQYHNKRVNCNLCNKEMNRSSLQRHKKKYCKMNLK